MSYKKQELLTLHEHLRSAPDFCGVCVARLLVFCVVFFVGSVMLVFWFSVLCFLWGLCCSSFGFLCCVFCGVCDARRLVFCVVFFVGSVLLVF